MVGATIKLPVGFVKQSRRGMLMAGFPSASNRASNLRLVESNVISPIDGANVANSVGVRPSSTSALWKFEASLGSSPDDKQSYTANAPSTKSQYLWSQVQLRHTAIAFAVVDVLGRYVSC